MCDFTVTFLFQIAVFVVFTSGSPILAFSGYFLQLKAMNTFERMVSNLSYFRFMYHGSMMALFGNNRDTLNCYTDYCHFKYPVKILEELAIEGTYWENFLGLILYDIFIRFLVLFTFWLKARRLLRSNKSSISFWSLNCLKKCK